MAQENIDASIAEIIDGVPEDPRIEKLRALLKTIRINRYAIPIVRELEKGDRNMAAQIAVEAKRAGIDVEELKQAVRTQKSWKGK